MVDKETVMRFLFMLIGALVLLSLAWRLLAFFTHLAFGLLHIVVLLAVVIFFVGLVRRLMLIR
jgi:hypothetical protein